MNVLQSRQEREWRVRVCSREMEQDRVVDQEGMLYNQFNTLNDFELIEKYAKVTDLWTSMCSEIRPVRLGFECVALEPRTETMCYCIQSRS